MAKCADDAPAQPGLIWLGDESRKALKPGDRVLIYCQLETVEPDEQGDIKILQDYGGGGPYQHWAKVRDIYAKLPEAKKPVAVGDYVSILGRTGSKGKVLAFASNGRAVVEYAAGDGINVAQYDVSCLEAC